WSGFTAITMAIGPVLGGWLVEHLSWRWAFFINLPLAAIVVAIALLAVPESRSGTNEPLDWLGACLATAGLGGVVYALIQSSPVASVAGAVALAAFLVVQARSTAPMLPLGLFRSGNFTAANLVTVFLYAGIGGVPFFIPLNL